MSAPQKTESGQSQNAPENTSKAAKEKIIAGQKPTPETTPVPASTPASAPATTPATTPAPAQTAQKPLQKGSKWAKLAGNGSVKRSLVLPKDGDAGSERSGTPSSGRRESKMSVGSQLSGIDLSKIHAHALQQVEEEQDVDKNKTNQVSNDSYLRSSIPYLPQWVAVVCLIMNVIIPGSGTIMSGFCVFCCGKPRVATKGDQVMETFCVNVWVGVVQLCTVTFMLVGWFWSFVWGIYMIILSVEWKRDEKVSKEKQLQALALTAFSSDVRPWSL